MSNSELSLIKSRLKRAGIELESAHDLYLLASSRDRAPIRKAIPILVDILPSLETSPLKSRVARTLAAKECKEITAKPLVSELQGLRQDIEDEAPYAKRLGWVIADALADVATEDVYDEIRNMIKDQRFGKAREMLPFALARIKKRRKETVSALTNILHDNEVAAHAISALAKLKATESLNQIKVCLGSTKHLVRKEAQKAVKN